MFKTEADSLKEGDRIRFVEESCYSPFKVGVEFIVTNIDTIERTITLERQKGITTCISFLEFNMYFEIIKPNKWTKWNRLSKDIVPSEFKCLCDDEEILYRYNGRKVEIKKGNIKVKSCCHKEDEFILEKGIEIALSKLYIEEKTIQKNRLELLIRKKKMDFEIEIKKMELDLSLFKKKLELEKHQYKKKYYKDDSMNGRVHIIGTLYVGDMKIKRPTRPWSSGFIPIGVEGKSNIYDYSDTQGKIEIKDTDNDNEEYQLKWIEVNYNGKRLLVCDRNILIGVSWDDLNNQGLIEGKEIIIDEQKYNIRLLSGGNTYRNNSYGGYPENNEWDRIIVNEGNFEGLTSLQNKETHNKVWNWYCCYCWCKETKTGNSDTNVVRGYYSARCFSDNSSSKRCSFIGWRPVLEVLE